MSFPKGLLAFSCQCEAVFIFETMPQLKDVPPVTWLIFEIFFTAVFTVEYLLRLFTATAFGGTVGNFFTRIMNICDLYDHSSV